MMAVRVHDPSRLPSGNLNTRLPVMKIVPGEHRHASGLTRSYAGRGTFVAATQAPPQPLIGRHLPAHLNEVRRHLEVPAARLAAKRRTQANVDELLGLIAKFDETEDPTDQVQVATLFHIAVARATGNPLFPRLIEDLRAVLPDQALAVSTVPGRTGRASTEHRAIFEAIRDGDADMADLAMRRHLATVESTSSSRAG